MGQLGNNPASTCSPSLWKSYVWQISSFSRLSTHSQDADKVYKGHLSEFTPLASLHAPSKPGSQRRGAAHQRSTANSHRCRAFQKKSMITCWHRTPDYCTFTPLLRFSDGCRCSKQGPGPETSVWSLFHRASLLLRVRTSVVALLRWGLGHSFCAGSQLKWPSLLFWTLWKVLGGPAAAASLPPGSQWTGDMRTALKGCSRSHLAAEAVWRMITLACATEAIVPTF